MSNNKESKLIIGGVDMWGNMMATQKMTDERFYKVKNVDPLEIQDEMQLALLDEVMEYAKAAKCFKYWSLKDPDPKEVRLEEFVDAIHFFLQQSNIKGIDPNTLVDLADEGEDVAAYYMNVLYPHMSEKQILTKLIKNTIIDLDDFTVSFVYFMAAGKVDGFTLGEIEKAYYQKNKINQERINSGY